MNWKRREPAFDSTQLQGNAYYISPNGNDENSGKTPQEPWQTLDKINAYPFAEGDAVLFERGGEWRGCITAQSGVTYADFGTGALPVINGSAQNYAKPELWQATEHLNVWKCTEKLHNVGVIAFDHSNELGNYGEKYGTILFRAAADKAFYEARGGREFDAGDLSHDLQFFSDLKTDELFLYSEGGNPGERFSSVEIGEQKHLFKIGAQWRGHDITLDGLRFRYTGAHGVSGGGVGTYNITVRNCVFDWIGGSVLNRDALYGNAVEMYGEVRGFTVENNWCYQIFDTGITFQASSRCESDVNFADIVIRNNLVEYCHWAIEYYNQPYSKGDASYARTVKNVLVENNTCRMGGMGWGLADRVDFVEPGTAQAASATLLCSWGLPQKTESFVVRGNVFDRCKGFLGLIQYLPGGDSQVAFSNNLYIQNAGWQLGKYHDARIDKRLFGESAQTRTDIAEDILCSILGDRSGTVVIVNGQPKIGDPVQYEFFTASGIQSSGKMNFSISVDDYRPFAGGVLTVHA